MKIKTYFFISFLASWSAYSLAAKSNLGSPGELHFALTVKQGTCELESDNILVEMGSMQLQRPPKVGRILGEKTFKIGLKDCGDVVRAYVTMDGTPDGDDADLFALDSGGATGVALKLTNGAGTQQIPIPSGGDAIEWNINQNTNNSLEYTAQYVATSTKATPGTANAVVNFSVTYE